MSQPRGERAPQSPRRPAAKKAAPANAPAPGGAYAHGPLFVLDADIDRRVTGYGIGGLILDVPAKSLPALVEWTLTEARLGAEKLHVSPEIADLRPTRQAKNITLTTVANHFSVWPAVTSCIERGTRRDDNLADAYRDWLTAA